MAEKKKQDRKLRVVEILGQVVFRITYDEVQMGLNRIVANRN